MKRLWIATITFALSLSEIVNGETKLLIELTGSNSSIDDVTAFAHDAVAFANDSSLTVTVEDVNECESATLNTCSEFSACRNIIGSFVCQCQAGFVDQNPLNPGRNCADIDECITQAVCSEFATCNNTSGSYTCTCNAGYRGDGTVCTDIDECSTGEHSCSPNAVCNNTIGFFACSCLDGFAGDGNDCTDINECSSGADGCSPNAVCNNTPGSFNCFCSNGFTGDGSTCTAESTTNAPGATSQATNAPGTTSQTTNSPDTTSQATNATGTTSQATNATGTTSQATNAPGTTSEAMTTQVETDPTTATTAQSDHKQSTAEDMTTNLQTTVTSQATRQEIKTISSVVTNATSAEDSTSSSSYAQTSSAMITEGTTSSRTSTDSNVSTKLATEIQTLKESSTLDSFKSTTISVPSQETSTTRVTSSISETIGLTSQVTSESHSAPATQTSQESMTSRVVPTTVLLTSLSTRETSTSQAATAQETTDATNPALQTTQTLFTNDDSSSQAMSTTLETSERLSTREVATAEKTTISPSTTQILSSTSQATSKGVSSEETLTSQVTATSSPVALTSTMQKRLSSTTQSADLVKPSTSAVTSSTPTDTSMQDSSTTQTTLITSPTTETFFEKATSKNQITLTTAATTRNLSTQGIAFPVSSSDSTTEDYSKQENLIPTGTLSTESSTLGTKTVFSSRVNSTGQGFATVSSTTEGHISQASRDASTSLSDAADLKTSSPTIQTNTIVPLMTVDDTLRPNATKAATSVSDNAPTSQPKTNLIIATQMASTQTFETKALTIAKENTSTGPSRPQTQDIATTDSNPTDSSNSPETFTRMTTVRTPSEGSNLAPSGTPAAAASSETTNMTSDAVSSARPSTTISSPPDESEMGVSSTAATERMDFVLTTRNNATEQTSTKRASEARTLKDKDTPTSRNAPEINTTETFINENRNTSVITSTAADAWVARSSASEISSTVSSKTDNSGSPKESSLPTPREPTEPTTSTTISTRTISTSPRTTRRETISVSTSSMPNPVTNTTTSTSASSEMTTLEIDYASTSTLKIKEHTTDEFSTTSKSQATDASNLTTPVRAVTGTTSHPTPSSSLATFKSQSTADLTPTITTGETSTPPATSATTAKPTTVDPGVSTEQTYIRLPELPSNFTNDIVREYIYNLNTSLATDQRILDPADAGKTVDGFNAILNSNVTLHTDVADIFFKTISGFSDSVLVEDEQIDSDLGAKMTLFVEDMLENVEIQSGEKFILNEGTLLLEAQDLSAIELVEDVSFVASTSDPKIGLILPEGLIKSSSPVDEEGVAETGSYRLAFTRYSDGRLFLDKSTQVVKTGSSAAELAFSNGQRILNTPVIGASIAGRQVQDSNESVQITLNKLISADLQLDNSNGTVETTSYTTSPECVWWNYTSMGWSNTGCKLVEASDSLVKCECNHLTSFAVIMTVEKTIYDPILTYLSYAGAGLSIAGLIWTIVTYTTFKSLRKHRSKKVLLHFCCAMCGVYVTYLFGIAAKLPSNSAQCMTTGFFMHFFTLSVIAWMSVEVFDMYFMFVKVMFGSFDKYMLKVGIIAWVSPFVVAITTIGVHLGYPDRELYPVFKKGTVCWLGKTGMMYAFIIPSCILLIINLIVFTVVLYHITCKRNHNTINRLGKSTKQVKTSQHIINALALLLLAGPTWIVGYFINIEPVPDGALRRVLSYIFVLMNAFQGFWIFIVFSIRPAPVRRRWVNLLTKGSLSEKSVTSTNGSHRHTGKVGAHKAGLFPTSRSTSARTDHSLSKRTVQSTVSNNSSNSDTSNSKSSTKSSSILVKTDVVTTSSKRTSLQVSVEGSQTPTMTNKI